MWERLGPEELAWKETCRRFAAEVIEPYARRADQENALPRAVHERAHAAGLMNTAFPSELGGRGHSHRMLAVGGEELAAACAPTAFSMGFNHGSLQPVLLGGTAAQRQRFVADLIARSGYAAIGLTEPASAGSNLPSIRTRAVRTSGGGWRVSGTKCMVGNGCDAELFVVLADAVDSGGSRGLSFFVVPRGAGVDVGPNTDKIGFRCVTTPTVRFDGAEIPDDHRIGELGGAEALLQRSLDYIRFGGTAVILGIVVGALRAIAPWLEERRVFPDEPLIEKSHAQLELGDLYTGVRTVRLLAWQAAERLDAGQPCALETAMAKLAASRLAISATDRIAQLYGWRGADGDYPLAKRVRDARVTTIFEGTSEIQLINIAAAARRSLAGDGWL